jgi:DNA-binding NarL/FixJ family response regulator
MIVDDEAMVATALRTFLELETDYAVLDYTSPVSALEGLARRRVDVVVADFMMPDLNGIDFLKEVRRLKPQAARVLLTGYADVENAIRAINEAGLYYYLEKPWDNEHLKLVIRNGIEQRVGQIVRPARADTAETAPEAIADRLEAVAVALLEGHDEALADEHRDLLVRRLRLLRRHSRDHEELILEFLGLRPLMRVDHVFEGQSVQAERLAASLHEQVRHQCARRRRIQACTEPDDSHATHEHKIRPGLPND